MKEKAAPYLGMALLPFVFIALELAVSLSASLFYGTMDWVVISDQYGISATLIHYGLTCIVWVMGAWLLYNLAKKRGFDLFENKSKVPLLNWIIVLLILILSIIFKYISWDMRFKPFVEFMYFNRIFGNQAILAFVGQYIYYFVESILILFIVIFGQKFGELAFKKTNVPWGGILCGLTWGLGHILTQDLFTGILGAAVSVAYGIVYLLLKRNAIYTYPILALMFML